MATNAQIALLQTTVAELKGQVESLSHKLSMIKGEIVGRHDFRLEELEKKLEKK